MHASVVRAGGAAPKRCKDRATACRLRVCDGCLDDGEADGVDVCTDVCAAERAFICDLDANGCLDDDARPDLDFFEDDEADGLPADGDPCSGSTNVDAGGDGLYDDLDPR